MRTPDRLRPSFTRLFVGLGLGLLVVLILSTFVGRYPKPYWMPPQLLFQDDMAQQLVLSLRLPRMLVALLLGMSLSAAGAVMQMIFRNPLVEPGFLGVTQGAAFGAALSILWLGTSLLLIEASATVFALLGLALSYYLARHLHFGGWVLRLVLAGIAVSALFASGNGVLKYLADPLTQLPEITFWLLGGLWGVTWIDLVYVLPLVLPGLIVIYLMRWRLNLLSLSDETAFSLGTAPGRERSLLLLCAVAATAGVTAVAGIVGWVGLIVPHMARRLCGANAQYTIPASMLIGGAFVVVCDDLGRSLMAGEIPLGILTSLIGALLFIGLMMRSNLKVRP
ncbi:MAG: iron ABC transporter permease [Thermoflexales bacterium]|nr:iron ABC transporter permease [Thermoflexales bacterium]